MTQIVLNAAIAAAIAQAAQEEDHTKAQAGGGGEYKPPAEGKSFARLIHYIEFGKSSYEWQGKKKTKENVRLTFELVPSAKYPATEYEENGVKKQRPITISINVNKTQGANGGWLKLVNKLNHAKTATHVAQLVGNAYLLTIVHNKVVKDGKETIYANINDDSGYLIAPPKISKPSEDGLSFEEIPANVPPAIGAPLIFLWDYADKEQWDSLFIDGEYPEVKDEKGNVTKAARSKNFLQDMIKKAENYIGSPIYNLLQNSGDELDVGSVEDARSDTKPWEDEPAGEGKSPEASADPLDGVA